MFNKPKIIAFNLSVIVILIFSVLYLVTGIIFGNFNWLQFVAINIILFVSSWLIYRYTLDNFIYEKIKLIYKTIHKIKISDEEKKKYYPKADEKVIERVNQDVVKWAEDKAKEIEELKKLENYRREFIGNVSHELKTPVFNIQGYILTLLEGGIDDKSINVKYLQRAEKSLDRMISIINDLEKISRLESGEIELKMEKFDIKHLIREVFDFLEIKAKKKNITLLCEYKNETSVYVFADKDKIRQVLINLVDNSINYGKANGKTTIGIFDMEENFLFEITDNGAGIAQHHIPRLFERFYRVDKGRSREEGGTGLGLAIVKHIIEVHNQSVNVRSTIGIGSTFAFTLKKA
ncbi:MAG: sensor histidine kinase [Bacteroidales bacterium]|nr:sensor histidine kinase [Bacteroidales bacterium]